MITEHSPEDKRCIWVMEPREQSKHVEGVMGQQKLVGSVGTATQPPKPGQHTSNRARGRAQKLDSHVGAVTEG